jgi:hypothetical protein
MNKLEKMGAKIISHITADSEFGWPPTCGGLIYQPERPVAETSVNHSIDSDDAVPAKDHRK